MSWNADVDQRLGWLLVEDDEGGAKLSRGKACDTAIPRRHTCQRPMTRKIAWAVAGGTVRMGRGEDRHEKAMDDI